MDSTDRRRLVVLVAGRNCLLTGVAADTAGRAAPGVAAAVALAAGTSVHLLGPCGAHVLLERTKIIRGYSQGGCASAVTRHPLRLSGVAVSVAAPAVPVHQCGVSMTLFLNGCNRNRASTVSWLSLHVSGVPQCGRFYTPSPSSPIHRECLRYHGNGGF